MSATAESIAELLDLSRENALRLVGPDHELFTRIKLEGQKIDFPLDNIESIEPTEEEGSFYLKLGREIVENRGRIMVVTGAIVLGVCGSIFQKKRSKS